MILFLSPYFEKKPWAGNEIQEIYNCEDGIGEAWIVSGYKNKSSIIINGEFKGQKLCDVWHNHKELFNVSDEFEFPVLLKLISSKEKLSIQVHPDDEYAKKRHNSLGKYECWYILPKNKANHIILGLNLENANQLHIALENNQLESYLKYEPIQEGDIISVYPGTVHAICENTFLLETQESSDITYRLYDYNRLPRRELHIEDAVNVISYGNSSNCISNIKNGGCLNNNYFDYKKININKKMRFENDNFSIVYVISGKGFVNGVNIEQYDSLIITSDEEIVTFDGNMQIVFVQPKYDIFLSNK